MFEIVYRCKISLVIHSLLKSNNLFIILVCLKFAYQKFNLSMANFEAKRTNRPIFFFLNLNGDLLLLKANRPWPVF